MRFRWYVVTGVFGVFFLLFDLLALGAAAETQPAIAAQARAESPLAETYIVVGQQAMAYSHTLSDVAHALSTAAFDSAMTAVEAQPSIALDTLYAAATGKAAAVARLAYWAGPLLTLLALLLFTVRERRVKLIANSGR